MAFTPATLSGPRLEEEFNRRVYHYRTTDNEVTVTGAGYFIGIGIGGVNDMNARLGDYIDVELVDSLGSPTSVIPYFLAVTDVDADGTVTAAPQSYVLDAELGALASVISEADRLFYFTGLGTGDLTPFTAQARLLLDDVTPAEQRGTLELGTAAVEDTTAFDAAGTAAAAVSAHEAAGDPHPQYLTAAEGNAAYQPLDSDLTAIAALTTTAYGRALLALANATALAAEVDSFFLTPAEGNAAYQPLDSDLTAIAALTTTTFGRAFLALADEAAFKAAVNLEAGTDFNAYSANLAEWSGLNPSANAGSLVTAADYAAMKALLAVAQADVSGLTTADSPQFAGVNVGHASNNTITSSAAGTIDVEGSRVYQRNNIYGTVSQTSTVPTGAIIEYGTNANGEYIRYADGTQIAWKTVSPGVATNSATGSLFQSSGWGSGSFPATFAATPVVTHSGKPGAVNGWTLCAVNPTSSNWGTYRFVAAVTDADTTGTGKLMAIGRWY